MAEGRTPFPKDADDWYVEPIAATRFLLDRESFVGPVWDPACGAGHVLTALLEREISCYGTDLRSRALAVGQEWWCGSSDFLRDEFLAPAVPYAWRSPLGLITNPPYGRALLAEAFIRRAMEPPLLPNKMAFMVNAKFLFAAGRAAGLFADHPPTRVWPIFPRPSCPPGGPFFAGEIAAEGGVENYCWLVYDRLTDRAPTQLRWDLPTHPI